VWASLAAGLALVFSGAAALDVPYLPQTEDLCGGAAVAMVYRYWGDAHADARQFAPLVDAKAGGIAAERLVDAVVARGWNVTPAVGSIDLLRTELAAGIPSIVLLEDRPRRYHFVVVVGMSESAVVVHDPAVGPSRAIPVSRFVEKWTPSNYWTIAIRPGEGGVPRSPVRGSPRAEPAEDGSESPPARATACDQLLDRALDDVRQRGFDAADAAFASVRRRCPASAGPLRELAGVRFAQQRWREAASFASDAVALDPHDAYAWDVLGSSRFMLDDLTGSLDAWNHIGKPQVDLVRIDGVTRMRYQLLAQALALTPNTMLTADAFGRAARRLADLPDQSSSRISYRPADDGFAVVEVAVVEPPTVPRAPIVWAATATRFVVNREADVSLPGGSGQGELWNIGWRWWNNRPRVALSFAAPRVGRMPGVWRVETSWEEQAYARSAGDSPVRERRAHGGVSVSDWLTGHLKYELHGGIDSWNGRRRTFSAGAAIRRQLFGDRLMLSANGSASAALGSGDGFRVGGLQAAYRSPGQDTARWLLTAIAGVDAVSAAAPFAFWPGAGDGHARSALLRAHPLLDDGIIDGPAFGRTLAYGTVEAERWLERSMPVRFGWAVFADAARPWRGLDGAADRGRLDAGIGMRLRVPGSGGVIRADFARGLSDGAHAFSVAWQRIV